MTLIQVGNPTPYDMVYIYYNLQLWVKQIERTLDVEAISLDGIDTTTTWRVETKRPAMESSLEWLQEGAQDEVVGESGRGGSGYFRVNTFARSGC